MSYYGSLGTYPWFHEKHQSWTYDGSKQEFFIKSASDPDDDTNYALTVQNSRNVKTSPYNSESNAQKWHVEYCWKNF